MTLRVKPWLAIPFRWVFQGREARREHRSRGRKRAGQDLLAFESLEGRVVLSGWGDSLAASLTTAGIVLSPIAAGDPSISPWAGEDAQLTKLETDRLALRVELQGLAAKSGVTIADLTRLETDSRAIAQAGFEFDPQALQAVTSALATAVAGGGDTAPAKASFTALFSGSTVPQSAIDAAFNDLVQIIHDSKVTPADLTTVAGDEATVQTDLGSLRGDREFRGAGGDFEIGAFPGGILAQSLASLGVATDANVGNVDPVGPIGRWISQDTQLSQLETDEQALQTELQGLAAKSGVTIADLTRLETDSLAIARAGSWFEGQGLQKAMTELATAVAGGGDTTQAKADFTALFSGSTVPQSAIDAAFNDLVQIIKDSKVTPADLTAVTSDAAAIRTDLSNLQNGHNPGGPGEHRGPGGNQLGVLGQSLTAIGIVTSPITVTGTSSGTGTGQDALHAKLEADELALRVELQSLAAKSGVTIADLTRLGSDSRTIAQTGFQFDTRSLQTALSGLATAVAGGGDTAPAKTSFTALFSGSTVPQSVVDTTFSDIVQSIKDSTVTPLDLTTVANDEAAIQTDKTNLSNGGTGSSGGTSGSGSGGSGDGDGDDEGSTTTTSVNTAANVVSIGIPGIGTISIGTTPGAASTTSTSTTVAPSTSNAGTTANSTGTTTTGTTGTTNTGTHGTGTHSHSHSPKVHTRHRKH